jgi:hypothetical protein
VEEIRRCNGSAFDNAASKKIIDIELNGDDDLHFLEELCQAAGASRQAFEDLSPYRVRLEAVLQESIGMEHPILDIGWLPARGSPLAQSEELLLDKSVLGGEPTQGNRPLWTYGELSRFIESDAAVASDWGGPHESGAKSGLDISHSHAVFREVRTVFVHDRDVRRRSTDIDDEGLFV